ncbi:MAG: ATP-dependent Clp protease proteolytic subunit [Myxococcota bacterium]
MALPEDHALPPMGLEEHLYRSRTVLVFGEITDAVAQRAGAALLAMSAESAAPILVVVSSPGGHVESGDVVHDLIRYVEPEVSILGTGWVASAGAVIYSAVPRERRLALPNTRFLLHQPRGAVSGPAADVEIEAAQMLEVRARLNQLFAAATGQPLERIERDTIRNHWMNAAEALEYGLVGRIVDSWRYALGHKG